MSATQACTPEESGSGKCAAGRHFRSPSCIDVSTYGDAVLGDVVNCTFSNNGSSFGTADGGAIQCGMEDTRIRDCFFFDNSIPDEGGALFIAGYGEVTDCFFQGNRAFRGRAGNLRNLLTEKMERSILVTNHGLHTLRVRPLRLNKKGKS